MSCKHYWCMNVTASDISARGFQMDIHTWGGRQVFAADVCWIAYSGDKKGVLSGQPFPCRKIFPTAEKQTERKGENSVTMQPISFLRQLSNLNTSRSYRLWNGSALAGR